MIKIRDARPSDAKAISDIYNHYVVNTIVTFEEQPVTVTDMEARIKLVLDKQQPWLVSESDGIITGYAYAGEWKSRCSYRFSLESTIYLQVGQYGRGLGSTLYGELLSRVKSKNYHALIGGIALPNEASVALHEKLGFRKIGQFIEVGYKFDRWIDVGYWELIFSK